MAQMPAEDEPEKRERGEPRDRAQPPAEETGRRGIGARCECDGFLQGRGVYQLSGFNGIGVAARRSHYGRDSARPSS